MKWLSPKGEVRDTKGDEWNEWREVPYNTYKQKQLLTIPSSKTKNTHIPTAHTNYYAGIAETDKTDETTSEAVLDSGATHTFFPSTYKTDKEQVNTPGEGILVGCARDGIQLKSYATDEAIWPY